MGKIFGMDMKQLALVIFLTCAIVFGAGYKTAQFSEKRRTEAVIAAKEVAASQQEKKRNITVYVTGAVKRSGVYTLPEGSRIVEALGKAELAKEADLNSINLAELMTDEMPIYVPRKGEADSIGSGGGNGSAGGGTTTAAGKKKSTTGKMAVTRNTGASMRSARLSNSSLGTGLAKGKVNINTAGSGDLDQLKGIGPALAERIIEYRNEHGRFNNISELKQVSGIGTKKFEEMQEQITI